VPDGAFPAFAVGIDSLVLGLQGPRRARQDTRGHGEGRCV